MTNPNNGIYCHLGPRARDVDQHNQPLTRTSHTPRKSPATSPSPYELPAASPHDPSTWPATNTNQPRHMNHQTCHHPHLNGLAIRGDRWQGSGQAKRGQQGTLIYKIQANNDDNGSKQCETHHLDPQWSFFLFFLVCFDINWCFITYIIYD